MRLIDGEGQGQQSHGNRGSFDAVADQRGCLFDKMKKIFHDFVCLMEKTVENCTPSFLSYPMEQTAVLVVPASGINLVMKLF